VYVKLPSKWAVFPVSNGAIDRTSAQSAGNYGVWKVLVDGAEKPSRSHTDEAAPAAPVGFVEVVPTALLTDPGSAQTTAGLRAVLLGSDPIAANGTDVDVTDYKEVEVGNGYWGNELTFTKGTGDGATTIVQLAYADGSFSRLYFLQLTCSSDCFTHNKA